jgi:hypothetical protein
MATFRATSNREESLASLVPGDIEVFQHDDFNTHDGDEDGWRFRTGLNVTHMLDFNDDASSVIVYSGTWELFEHIDFQGKSITLKPGYYGSLQAAGLCNDCLSSFRRVG